MTIIADMSYGRKMKDHCQFCGVGPGRLHAEDCVALRPEVIVAQPVQEHSHYIKDVSHLKKIDVYRVLELYEVNDPVLAHVAKKALVTGGRGHKSLEKDVQDMIDSLLRWQEMRREESLNKGE